MPISIKNAENRYLEEDEIGKDELLVLESLKKHVTLMLEDEWYITLKFDEVDGEAAECEVKPEYRTAEIVVDLAQVVPQMEYLDNYIRHELLHVLTWNFFDIAGTLAYKRAGDALQKLEESVICRLEQMPLWDKVYDK